MSAAMTFPPYHGYIDDPEGLKTVIVGTVLPAIATVMVLLRFIIRYTSKAGIGADDITIALVLIMVWAISACIIYVWHNGLGLHVPKTPIRNLEEFLRTLYAFEIFYIADFGICKVSILLFYQRVFSVTRERRNLVWGLIAFMVLFTFVFEMIFIFQCKPLHFFWSRVSNPKDGTCMNPLILYGVYTGINILTDLMIWLYPLPIVWKLHVTTSQKVGLALIFIVGALVCVVSIIRASTIPKIVSKDFTYDDIDAAIWAVIECSLCCIVACLPTIRALFVRRKKRDTSTGPSGYSGGRGYSNPKVSITSSGMSRGSGKKWGSGIETTIHITQDPDPEDGLPLTATNKKDGWNRLHEGGEGARGKDYGW